MTTHVTETPAAASDVALCHFEDMLAFETDCWDVHESLKSAEPDFIVVDVRGPASFAKGHVRGAINIPHREITAQRMAEYSKRRGVHRLLRRPPLQWRQQGCGPPRPPWPAREDNDRRRHGLAR